MLQKIRDFFAICSIKTKLISIFIVIKVLPLLVMVWLIVSYIQPLNTKLGEYTSIMGETAQENINYIASIAITDSVEALDYKSIENQERISTELADNIAKFLYERDNDIRIASVLPVDKEVYQSFITHNTKEVIEHPDWVLSKDKTKWESPYAVDVYHSNKEMHHNHIHHNDVLATDESITGQFHYHRPYAFIGREKPLYLSISFIDLSGKEQLKVTNSNLLTQSLVDVSNPENTFLSAEDYFSELEHLDNDDIYVSEVIGEYVGSRVIGPYTPITAQKAGISYNPMSSAYAGAENPYGKKFRGIIRWVKPVVQNNKRIGYVSLVLDHTHVMQFSDTLLPNEMRYSDIADASDGNYVAIWDHKGKNISHPRHYFIVGYDKTTGKLTHRWLEQEMYANWQQSGIPMEQFINLQQTYQNQSYDKSPAWEQIKKGELGLDCRYLNFAPYCTDWNNINTNGGSGSFYISWDRAQLRTSVSTIPYYTGQYGELDKGFGFVSVNASTQDFHAPALISERNIRENINRLAATFYDQAGDINSTIQRTIKELTLDLTIVTLLMIIIVIIIAIMIALTITRRVTNLSQGIQRFKSGTYNYRLQVQGRDELSDLSKEFNEMADKVAKSIQSIKRAKYQAEEHNRHKNDFLAYVSHELRTPLNSIVELSDYMRRSVESDDDHQKTVQLIHEKSIHLERVVDDILDLAQIEAGRMKLHLINADIFELFAALNELYTQRAKDLGIAFRHIHSGDEEHLLVYSDVQRLRQLLTNILDNSCKFTSEGEISLLTVADAKYVYIEIHDTGEGIDEKLLPNIFDQFYQTESFEKRNKEGIGLGLLLAKAIIDLLNGKIECSSQVGKGTQFKIRIPRNLQ